ncbi:glycoside hydrolase family 13 protein [Shewanella jiangmenensis]|nr:glycoside hydrolase family 13 protein [Shewanella jiangmenensis]
MLLTLLLGGCSDDAKRPQDEAQAQAITDSAGPSYTVSPPNWWAGMKTPSVELMIHGADIGRAKISLPGDSTTEAKGVQLESVKAAESPNYLFVTLNTEHAKPGDITLNIQIDNKTHKLRYRLLPRKSGHSHQGYNNADVLYLITPDRFANGDSANDNIAGFSDAVKPGDPDGRHGGDIQGIRNRLPYLADLGVTQLWINPLLENNQPKYSYHGYSITDHYRIDPRFGSNEDYLALADEARRHGLGIVMDVVLNHIGSGHPWLEDLPFSDWLNPKAPFTSHRRTAVQDPYSAESDKRHFSDGWFTDTMPDLNQRNPHMARFLIQHTLWWIESAGLSGLRIDTWSYSDKAFLKAFSNAVLTEYPRLNLVGEEWSNNPAIVSYWQAGKQNRDGYDSELPGLMDFPLYETLLNALNEDENWDTGFIRLYEALANDTLYPNAQNLVLFEGNHDTNRLYSVLGRDMARFKIALAYVLLSNRVPQLFYGTEFAMQSPVEGRNDGAVRANMPFFSETSLTDADISTLPASAKEAHGFIRSLLHFRRQSAAIQRGRLVHFVPENGLYVQFRLAPCDGPATDTHACEQSGKNVMIIFNKNPKKTELNMARFADILPPGSKVNAPMDGNEFTLPETLSVSHPVTVLEF